MNGLLNLIAFLALLVAGAINLISGWTLFGGFPAGSRITFAAPGIWDIWIYRRNLPLVANQKSLEPTTTTKELATPGAELIPPAGVAESTTHKLDRQ